jgi:cell division protein FtsW (lipid II flippase)
MPVISIILGSVIAFGIFSLPKRHQWKAMGLLILFALGMMLIPVSRGEVDMGKWWSTTWELMSVFGPFFLLLIGISLAAALYRYREDRKQDNSSQGR